MPERSSLALCICTADRPRLLARCLEAIFSGSETPAQVVVSDDSLDRRENERICAGFPVDYGVGPRRGLCANRNRAVSRCRLSHVSLLDDDALVAADFVARAERAIAGIDDRTLLAGDVIEAGNRSPPTNTGFLGFFGATPKAKLKSINLNASVFPRRAFDEASFDERIAYGYEDADLCAELIVRGYEIRHEPSLTVRHEPPARTAAAKEGLRRDSTRARFYTTLKRYLLLERRFGAGLAFLVIAPSSEVAVWTRRRDPRRGLTAIPDLAWALRALVGYARGTRSSGPDARRRARS